ncbi:MAG: DNA repair protein RecO [Candidatus Marinimicrobia bacterium]|nr:DNA repair protein RecO [Candidatus Neomarinimicrobiota bacterium]
MTLIKTEALVLKTIPFQETSSIVRLFTKEQGKISVIAKGARRMKSALRGYLEPLNYIEAIYYFKITRDIQTLSKVDLLQSFFSNTRDIECTLYGTAVLEVIDKVVRDHQYDDEIFYLAVQILKNMDLHADQCIVLFADFLLAVADILGYKLDTSVCSQCKARLKTAIYNPGSGRLICRDCGRYTSSAYKLSEHEIQFLNDLPGCNFDIEVNISVEPSAAERITQLLIKYLSYHLDYPLNLKSLSLLSEISQ